VSVLPFPVVSFLTRHRKLGALALRCLPDIRHGIKIPPIGRFDIRLRRNRSFWIRHPLAGETLMLGYLRRLVRPGDTVYDVGANLGLYTRFALHFGAGLVVSFEPMSENVELLRRNVGHADVRAADVRVMVMAVGDTDGSEMLQIDDVMSGTASLDRVRAGEASFGRKTYGYEPLTERVRIARLDTLVFEERLPPPRVMKIDIEGAEILALRGGARVLREYHPDLLIELHGVEMVEGVLRTLDELGYHSYAYVKDGKKYEYRQVSAATAGTLQPYDYVVASTDAERLVAPIEPFQDPAP